MSISKRGAAAIKFVLAIGAILALLGCLFAGVRHAHRQMEDRWRRTEQLREERWLAEQKQALISGTVSNVHFYSTHGTDKLLAQLAGMPEIKSLMFELTDLTDEGVETIAGLPNITSLTLYGGFPRVGDAGLATLSRSRSLETLKLVNVDVTDRGLAALGSFPSLDEATIYRDSFRDKLLTDDAVDELIKLHNLGKINISGGWLSKAAVAKLKESLPNCYVVETAHWRGH